MSSEFELLYLQIGLPVVMYSFVIYDNLCECIVRGDIPYLSPDIQFTKKDVSKTISRLLTGSQ